MFYRSCWLWRYHHWFSYSGNWCAPGFHIRPAALLSSIWIISSWEAVTLILLTMQIIQRNIKSMITNLKRNPMPIERTTGFNFLCVTIDENWSWNTHTPKTTNKIARTIGAMNRLKTLPSFGSNAELILPHLQYYQLTVSFKLIRMIKPQKRAIHIITQSKCNAHKYPLFKQMNLSKLSDLLNISVLKLYYKYQMVIFPIRIDIHRIPLFRYLTLILPRYANELTWFRLSTNQIAGFLVGSVPKPCLVPAPTTVKLPHASGHSSGNRQGHVTKTKRTASKFSWPLDLQMCNFF